MTTESNVLIGICKTIFMNIINLEGARGGLSPQSPLPGSAPDLIADRSMSDGR